MIHKSNFKSVPGQTKRLDERHGNEYIDVYICGEDIVIHPGVYKTSGDTELMIESVKIKTDQSFLEIGCGSGAVSLAVAKHAQYGVGVDVNTLAVVNAQDNADRCGVKNVQFTVSNVFENVTGVYDVIICNPPYNNHEAKDDIERMFWDPGDEMKHMFFKRAGEFLKDNGHIYFGWADFADIEVNLPLELADMYGYRLVHTYVKKSKNHEFNFYVFEFVKE